ncbi:MAG: copper resistance protein B [Gammaproteobacteria bacterium]|nr:copper resistance protein B [Gammaproteobacteria bacterium]
MRAIIFIVVAISSIPLSAQHMADAYYEQAEMEEAREILRKHHGGQANYLLMADRSEYQSNSGKPLYVWEAQGWYGYDENKFWLKTEGEYEFDGSELEEMEIQGLYSRAISSFWDIQAGIRHDVTPNPSRSYAVIGVQGLAPYWFEIDTAAFVSDKGDVSFRLEAEYELRLQQRLLLQPRVEMNVSLSNDKAIGIGSGLSGLEAGVRIRYEISREFAPYLGVNWKRAFGTSADILEFRGDSNNDISFIAGLRLWY